MEKACCLVSAVVPPARGSAGRQIEIPCPKHLRQPLRLRVRNPSRTDPSSPAVRQAPSFATILVGVRSRRKCCLLIRAAPPSFHATQSSRTTRDDRIQYTRHPNLLPATCDSGFKPDKPRANLNPTYHLLPTVTQPPTRPRRSQRPICNCNAARGLAMTNAPEPPPAASAPKPRALRPRDAATLIIVERGRGKIEFSWANATRAINSCPTSSSFPAGRSNRGTAG